MGELEFWLLWVLFGDRGRGAGGNYFLRGKKNLGQAYLRKDFFFFFGLLRAFQESKAGAKNEAELDTVCAAREN